MSNDPAKPFMRRVSSLSVLLLLLLLPLLIILPKIYNGRRSTLFSVCPTFQRPNLTFQFKSPSNKDGQQEVKIVKPDQLNVSRYAVCLVGGARRFELTWQSIVDNVLEAGPEFDLYVHSPLDENSFKFSLLKMAPRIASVRLFQPTEIPVIPLYSRVLKPDGSPKGIQGLLQYFSLVEGCLTMIQDFQSKNNFTYDWIVRTRVDGYWNAPIPSDVYEPGKYVFPPGSSFGGINDRFGAGDLRTSIVALSRLSVIQELDLAGYRRIHAEGAYRAQLAIHHVPIVPRSIPFCIVSDRNFEYPPNPGGVPVASLTSSTGALDGAYCRVCKKFVCKDECVAKLMEPMNRKNGWVEWRNGTLELCDGHEAWETGWEEEFDRSAGVDKARVRKQVEQMEMKECVDSFEETKRRAVGKWEAPPAEEICSIGLRSRHA